LVKKGLIVWEKNPGTALGNLGGITKKKVKNNDGEKLHPAVKRGGSSEEGATYKSWESLPGRRKTNS